MRAGGRESSGESNTVQRTDVCCKRRGITAIVGTTGRDPTPFATSTVVRLRNRPHAYINIGRPAKVRTLIGDALETRRTLGIAITVAQLPPTNT